MVIVEYKTNFELLPEDKKAFGGWLLGNGNIAIIRQLVVVVVEPFSDIDIVWAPFSICIRQVI